MFFSASRTFTDCTGNSLYIAGVKIRSAQYVISSPDWESCPKPDRPEYAFIGRSNVGKSSLINMICHSRNLAKTSSSPGKTQLINHFQVESTDSPSGQETSRTLPVSRWYLVDLPGYGFAKVSLRSRRRWEQMIENYLRKRENLMSVFVLIDSRHKPQRLDLQFVDQLGKWGVPFCLVFTKADQESQRKVSQQVQAFLEEMQKHWDVLPPHFVTSAVKNLGKKKLLEYIDTCNRSAASPEK